MNTASVHQSKNYMDVLI